MMSDWTESHVYYAHEYVRISTRNKLTPPYFDQNTASLWFKKLNNILKAGNLCVWLLFLVFQRPNVPKSVKT